MNIKRRPPDILCSLIVRTRDGWTCQRCFTRHQIGSKGLHASHFWGRSKGNTRHDLRNLDAICEGCHAFFHANPEEYRQWKIKRMGEQEFKKLDIDAHLPKKRDDAITMIYLQQLAKEYGLDIHISNKLELKHAKLSEKRKKPRNYTAS